MTGNMIANTFATYSDNALREDLTDVIWNVSPTETPFATAIAKAKATQPFHQWQEDSLANANSSNAAVQGDDISSFDSVTATTKLGNYTQISRKTMIIAGTDEVSIKAGMKSQVAYQVTKKGRELRRDIEAVLLSNQGYTAPASGTAPLTGTVLAFLGTNTQKNSGSSGTAGADPVALTGADARTDATNTLTITEAMLKSTLESVFTNAADEPDLFLVPPAVKQTVSTFTGNATRFQPAETKELVAAISVYVSDFGEIKVVPDRFMRTRDALIINSDLFALAWLRPIKLVDLATTGDAIKKMLIGEYALESRNEKGNGGIFDINS